jgi:glycine oxidase
VKSWDVIVVGGGIIGLSLSVELHKRGAKVLVVERGEPGHEASSAAGGMLVDCSTETPPALRPLATASARMYPEFVHEMQVESGVNVDVREHGAIVFPSPDTADAQPELVSASLLPAPLAELEPALAETDRPAFFISERSVDPRGLTTAAWKTAKKRGVDFSSGDPAISVNVARGRVTGVSTAKTAFAAPKVVNCAGAWAGQIAPHSFPTRPVKGQMLCLAAPSRNLLKHVVRSPQIYLIPRSDGRILVGTTVEEAGFDKRTDPATIQHFHQSAMVMVPQLQKSKILEDWAGLRPGTPDALPILGATSTPGYYVATGHFRDGILLAPLTAHIMASLMMECELAYDIKPFSPQRFATIPASP